MMFTVNVCEYQLGRNSECLRGLVIGTPDHPEKYIIGCDGELIHNPDSFVIEETATISVSV